MSGLGTTPEDLEAHAKLLDGTLAPDLQEAVDAAGQVKLGAESMGVICQVYSFIFDDELETAKDMLTKLPQVMEAASEQLRGSAGDYRNTDQGERNTFDGMHR